MQKTEKISIVTRFLGNPISRSGNEYLFICPNSKCQSKKMSVNFDKNVFKCWVCNYRGKNIFNLIKRFIGSEEIIWDNKKHVDLSKFNQYFFHTEEPDTKTKFNLFNKEFKPLFSKGKSSIKTEALNYLEHRGLSYKDLLSWRICYVESGDLFGRIIIPSFNEYGLCDYYIARAFRNYKFKYWGPHKPSRELIFNEVDIDWTKPIILVEGVFDAIKVGYNCVPLMGSNLEINSKLFHKILENNSEVYIGLDNEPKAQLKCSVIAEKLKSFSINVKIISWEPYNDPGEMEFDDIIKCIENAQEYNFKQNVMMALNNLNLDFS